MKPDSIKFLFFICMILMMVSCTKGGTYTYGYYSGKKKPQTATPTTSNARKSTTARPADVHTVEKGETLYSIAWAYGHDVRDVANWNDIHPPYTIYPKQIIRVRPPSAAVRHSRDPVKATETTNSHQQQRVPTRAHTSVTKAKTAEKISWQWPTNGKIIGRFSARDTGKKGLDIAGSAGQRIHASANGEVVYAGSGLRGYGKLIIIKHNETYFSAYAHNRRLVVKESQNVKRGQHIADMGNTEADQTMLHFEVRRNGKPVDPLKYLPRRR